MGSAAVGEYDDGDDDDDDACNVNGGFFLSGSLHARACSKKIAIEMDGRHAMCLQCSFLLLKLSDIVYDVLAAIAAHEGR